MTEAPSISAATLICLVSWLVPAAAHDPSEPNAAWYKSLTSNRGEACCTAHRDCETVSQYRQSLVPGGYEALWHGEWARIDPSAVLHRADNPTGLPVLCVHYLDGHPIARCFIRPSEG